MTAERFDAFVSYGHGDAEWVHTLAENLERLDLHVFLDDWELVPGDLLAVRLQEGLDAADAVVFVLRRKQGRLADAVRYQIQALAIHEAAKSPEVVVDVRVLAEQRAEVGDQEFERLLRTLSDDNNSIATIMQVTAQVSEAGS